MTLDENYELYVAIARPLYKNAGCLLELRKSDFLFELFLEMCVDMPHEQFVRAIKKAEKSFVECRIEAAFRLSARQFLQDCKAVTA